VLRPDEPYLSWTRYCKAVSRASLLYRSHTVSAPFSTISLYNTLIPNWTIIYIVVNRTEAIIYTLLKIWINLLYSSIEESRVSVRSMGHVGRANLAHLNSTGNFVRDLTVVSFNMPYITRRVGKWLRAGGVCTFDSAAKFFGVSRTVTIPCPQ
jgi:hypothetical protein